MSSPAEFVIKVVELLEAEGRACRRHVVRLALSLVLVAVLGLVVTGGVVMLSLALYVCVASANGTASAALVLGLVCIAVSALGIYGVWRWTKAC